jgi:phosphoesterase RecJ-like protein
MHGTGKKLGDYSEKVPKDALLSARSVGRVLAKAQKILVLGHVGADGDVAGSSLGLAQALREMGKKVVVYNEAPYPETFHWLVGAKKVVHVIGERTNFDATVSVDAADPARLGKHFPDSMRRGTFVWVDHHRIDPPPGDVNYIDLTAAAVGEQIAQILRAMKHPLSQKVAECLYVSLMTDTGTFRYANTSVRAFNLAGQLVKAGVNPWRMTEKVLESQAPQRMWLLQRIMPSLYISDCGRFGSFYVRRKDQEAVGAKMEHVHGLVNYIRAIRGIEIAVIFVELAQGIKVSLRSKGHVSCQPVLKRLGGTGHRNAGSIILTSARRNVTDRVYEALRQSMPHSK